jgi:O-antigen/teichoic acid export membrane protein
MSADLPEDAGRNLSGRMTRGAAWMIGLRFTDRNLGFLSTIILARLLVPADFGIVVLAMAMIGTIDDLADFGFEQALIQNQKAVRTHYDTAWTMGMVRGAMSAAIIAALAEPLALYFEDARLRDVLLTLALVPFLSGFYNIGTVAFRKELTLGKEFVFRIVPRIIGVLTTIALAFAFRNYWALVYGTLASIATRLVFSYVMHSYRPRISIAAARDIMGFSKWMLVTSVADLASQKFGTLIIAKFLDTASLGIYSMANQIANIASTELIAPIKQALFPGYAKLAHDTALLKKAFLDVYGILVLLALPAAIGIGLTAEFFVPLLLGPKWTGTISLIGILVISGGLRSLSSHVRPVYLALNMPHFGAYAALGRAIVHVPALIFALQYYGIEGAAIAHAAGHVAVLLGSLYLMHRLLGVSIGDILRACWRPLVGCVLMVLAVLVVKWFPPVAGIGSANLVLLLVLAVSIGILTYIGVVLFLWWLSGQPLNSAESYLLAYAYRALRKLRSTIIRISSGASR